MVYEIFFGLPSFIYIFHNKTIQKKNEEEIIHIWQISKFPILNIPTTTTTTTKFTF